MPPIDSRPCACGATIVVPRPPGLATSDVVGRILAEHYAGADHSAWSIARRWSELVPDVAREDVPIGAEFRRRDRLELAR